MIPVDRSPLLDVRGADLHKADLSGSNLRGADLRGANLRGALLIRADLDGSNLSGADLSEAYLFDARLFGADISGANLQSANLVEAALSGAKSRLADFTGAALGGARFRGADLSEVTLRKADLGEADLRETNLRGADLSETTLIMARLRGANLSGANLSKAVLFKADLNQADLSGANLSGADLSNASLVETNLVGTVLTGCSVYGISAWNAKLSEGTSQQNLVITRGDEPKVTVDNIEVAQFVYLLLHSEKIRDVIDTIGRKGVLLLGRFTEGRLAVLERLRDELRKRGYLPIVFNFDKPETKDFTETVRLLAGLSKFVIADVTNPKSAPLELQATVPECMIPFRPIIEEGERPFAMLEDLWIKHREWVFEPIYYSSLDALVGALDEKIIRPAEVRFAELLARKAEKMKGEHV